MEITTLFTLEFKERFSRKNDELYYDLELVDGATGKLYHTYISRSNKNFVSWGPVLNFVDLNPNETMCIVGKFKTIKNDPTLINADCIFTQQETFDKNTFLHTLYNTFFNETA